MRNFAKHLTAAAVAATAALAMASSAAADVL
jgi:hypothetical protein